jgi:uncharacterized membrane protein
MNEIVKSNTDLEKNRISFTLLVRALLLIGIIIIFSLIMYYVFSPKQGYTYFGILNEKMKAQDYPTEVRVDENVQFYVTMGNFLGRDSQFRVEVLKGNNETIRTLTGAIYASSAFNITNIVLKNGHSWTSGQLNITFNEIGSNQSLIAELYESKLVDHFLDIIYLNLNVTA